MINAQHAHIYRIHTLHFIFGEMFFLKFYQYSPNHMISHVFHNDVRLILDGSLASTTTTHCGLHLRRYPDF
jgi:hypothetical protein